MATNITAADRRALHKAGQSSYTGAKALGGENLSPLEPAVFGSSLVPVASLTTAASTVYARYLGRATGGRPLDKIAVVTSGSPSVTVVTTVGFAVSSDAPSQGVAQSLTIRTAVALTTTGSAGSKQTASINYQPRAGEHVWVYSHHTATGTQPTIWAHGGEVGQGVLTTKGSTPTAPAVGATVTSMTLPSAAVTAQAPLLLVQ